MTSDVEGLVSAQNTNSLIRPLHIHRPGLAIGACPTSGVGICRQVRLTDPAPLPGPLGDVAARGRLADVLAVDVLVFHRLVKSLADTLGYPRVAAGLWI
jgi:hypothetical protein